MGKGFWSGFAGGLVALLLFGASFAVADSLGSGAIYGLVEGGYVSGSGVPSGDIQFGTDDLYMNGNRIYLDADDDTFIHNAVDDVIRLYTVGSQRLDVTQYGMIGSNTGNPSMRWETASDTNPNFTPDKDEATDGLGGDSGEVALITDSVARLVVGDTMVKFPGSIKSDTGDPGSPEEGQITMNTFDNAIKIYVDGGWRSLATW